MPKLDGTHIASRLRERLEELRAGKEVAPRDLRSLLTNEQEAAMDATWAEQQALRKMKRARTKVEEAALGWRTKRDIHIEAYEKAISEADDGMIGTLEELQRKAELRGARIYMNAYAAAKDAEKAEGVARNLANNELTRNGLNRSDGRQIRFGNRRDKEVWDMEQKILGRMSNDKAAEELEQFELRKGQEKALGIQVKKVDR